MDPNPSSSKAHRKTIEKKRRNDMKALYSTLTSLIPHQSSTEDLSICGQIEGATNYIKKLQFDLQKLEQRKENLLVLETSSENLCNTISGGSSSTIGGLNLPSIDVRVTGSTMEVIFITGKNCEVIFSDIVRMLHEEGAEVVMANFSLLDEAFFYTIHCKVDYGESEQDYAAERISGRLRSLVCDI